MLKRALALLGLTFVLVSCEGLSKTWKDIQSACTPDGSGQCSEDGKTFSRCVSGHFVVEAPCGGDKGCYKVGTQVKCDESKGVVGDACTAEGAACSRDGKLSLVCKDKVLVLEATCTGPKGCTIDDGKRYCDRPRSTLGGKCVSEGLAACTLDEKATLRCESGVLVAWHECLGPKGCFSEEGDGKVHCDQSIATVGAGCTSGHACSADGKSRVVCENGKFVVDMTCSDAKGCRVEDSKVYCNGPTPAAK